MDRNAVILTNVAYAVSMMAATVLFWVMTRIYKRNPDLIVVITSVVMAVVSISFTTLVYIKSGWVSTATFRAFTATGILAALWSLAVAVPFGRRAMRVITGDQQRQRMMGQQQGQGQGQQ